jgi:hypothetical protein
MLVFGNIFVLSIVEAPTLTDGLLLVLLLLLLLLLLLFS